MSSKREEWEEREIRRALVLSSLSAAAQLGSVCTYSITQQDCLYGIVVYVVRTWTVPLSLDLWNGIVINLVLSRCLAQVNLVIFKKFTKAKFPAIQYNNYYYLTQSKCCNELLIDGDVQVGGPTGGFPLQREQEYPKACDRYGNHQYARTWVGSWCYNIIIIVGHKMETLQHPFCFYWNLHTLFQIFILHGRIRGLGNVQKCVHLHIIIIIDITVLCLSLLNWCGPTMSWGSQINKDMSSLRTHYQLLRTNITIIYTMARRAYQGIGLCNVKTSIVKAIVLA